MLQTKELVKIYKPKKGIPVTALNKVTITFPEKGMVFLLGKSGSGKSTLLNVLGGLDDYNGGEIIIKGVSSKYFRKNHFDSYRNTYVGFIFQEYHVLDEFTVGANIALAIELQNRKATDEEINEILKEVDLEGYGNRKPNELSGGQKQRVAIARALIKKPEIIMADEPTGALDSNTGRQILETLKKLSKEKLVIVVSHDREFAENYGDRIIELADGEVFNDVEVSTDDSDIPFEGISFAGNTVEVTEGYHLTEEDRIAINEYIDKLKSGKVTLEVGAKKTAKKRFVPTDSSKIKLHDGSAFKPIKSRLPFKNAVKMGVRALNYKKFRLALTILLSCISFAFFGLADTFSAFTDTECRTNTLYDNGYQYVSVSKARHVGEGDSAYWKEDGYKLSQENFDAIQEATGVKMNGVFVPQGLNFDYTENTNTAVSLTETSYNLYNKSFSGIAEITKESLKDAGFKIIGGELPDGSKDEIAISEYVLEIFKNTYYGDGTYTVYPDGTREKNFFAVKEPKHIIGKYLDMNGRKYKITAVIDTGFNMERYDSLLVAKEKLSNSETMTQAALYSEFETASTYSFARVMMVGEGYLDQYVGESTICRSMTDGKLWFSSRFVFPESKNLARASLVDLSKENIYWVDEPKTELGEKELILTTDAFKFTDYDKPDNFEDMAKRMREDNEYTAWKDFYGTDADDGGAGEKGYKVVGIMEPTAEIYSSVICHDYLYTQFVDVGDNVYNYAVGGMPEGKNNIRKLVKFCYAEGEKNQFWIRNAATWKLDSVSEMLHKFARIFLFVGLGFALFAALMLANFISTSISYKKEEIGILRAIGSRGYDVFRIFFAESSVIAFINFVLSTVIVGIASSVLNEVIRDKFGQLFTVLDFGMRQGVLLLFVSTIVAFLASYFPVYRVATMKPIDAIRNK